MKDTLFHQRLREKGFLILTHRGMRGGNIPENTIKSTQLAYQLGSDLVEVDIARSKDGVYYLFHHNNEKRLLGVENGSLEKLTSAEIDALAYLNGIGDDSGYHLEKLSDFLAWLPVDGLVNIDRSWFYWDDPAFMRLFVDTQTLDRVFFKSPLEDELLAKLNSYRLDVFYMPILREQMDMSYFDAYPYVHCIGAELLPTEENSPLLAADWRSSLREAGYLVLLNGINIGVRHNLFYQFDEDQAVLNPSEGWGHIVAHRPDVIQTDWPFLLAAYRQNCQK